MSIVKSILAQSKLSQEEIDAQEALRVAKANGSEIVDGTGAPADASRGQEHAPLEPASGGKPDADNPEVKDKSAGAKTDPDAPATVDSPVDAGKDAGSTTGKGAKDLTDVNNSADIAKVSKEGEDETAVEVEPEVAEEVAAALDPEDEVISDVDAAGEAAEEVGEITDDVVQAEDDAESLTETVATMEAMVERGFVSLAELTICSNRGRRIAQRYDIYIPSLAQENLTSEEGRLEQLAQTARDLKLANEGIAEGIKAGWTKLREKAASALKQLVDVNARMTSRIQRLEAAVGAIDKSEAKGTTVSLSRSVHRFLTDASGKLLTPTDSAQRLASATQEVLNRYPLAIVAASKDKPASFNKKVLDRLPAGLTCTDTPDGYPVFRTTRLSDKSDRGATPIVAPAQLAKILTNAKAIIDLLGDRNIGFAKAINEAESKGDPELIKRVNMMAGHLIDFYFYAQRVVGALLGYVAAQVAQYGVKAKA